MDRPNTVAGLLAKRQQFQAVRLELEHELRKVVCDLDHLDAAIELFDVKATPVAIGRYTRHRARRGEVQRFLLAHLRQADGPLTSKELTEAWVVARRLRTDEGTYVVLRKRIGACLIKLRASGLVRNGQGRGGYAGYELVGDRPEPD